MPTACLRLTFVTESVQVLLLKQETMGVQEILNWSWPDPGSFYVKEPVFSVLTEAKEQHLTQRDAFCSLARMLKSENISLGENL